MGDFIYLQFVIVNYGINDFVIYIVINYGYFYVFDVDMGYEYFVVVLKEMLVNVKDFYQDVFSYQYIYGLDGYMVLCEFNNKKYFYVGMCCGGCNYYVFDIMFKMLLSLVFIIDGGSVGFEKLG